MPILEPTVTAYATPSLTKMNAITNFFSNPKTKKTIFISSGIIALIIIYIAIKVLPEAQTRQRLTIPVIVPTVTPQKPFTPLDTTNPHNPEQKLVFNWGSVSPTIPNTMTNYSVKSPLINSASITVIANKLGFTTLERSTETDENSFLWMNDNYSLFGSPTQNQIMFNSVVELPQNNSVITQEEALSITRNVVSNLFGETVLSTFNPNAEIKYLNLQQQTEEEPIETTPDKANIINVNFHQTINGLRLINLSRTGETLSVAIDTSKKLYLLYVHGGYLSLAENGQSSLINFSSLIDTAPTNAIRISYSKDIPSEAAFTEASIVNINVNSVTLGYFQREDNQIFPVFIIEGLMSAKGLSEYPATYIVPATQ
ncbi:MAG: hypothetical protein UW68_C0041G0003 [Candidatus Collierbacteria bacterium GW2011_GWB1_44_6]|uniref:Uncharacterized protein n=2 Tax=Candidatus Collieribacteriota TaxID=1752725 RepID=A0A0G1JLN8_9BACT|nr:MAG: hypothetical protein UV68_C0014G0023 [Candidatus Collierbacteria bacterium GW2011_GWC2_43_12]KKT72298.1 MAG: hypothetical protein UW68_C0041G0003 [Candidatus Collierbacteria bacterium GW2011_GWB1_44_6]KKT82116.1 MAG: hypothetical protein UW80_C0041G0006 [Microgenomates group bacterium GW2011_GWC1_44_9]